MKSAYALLRKGAMFIQSYSKTTTGLWVATGPVYIVEEGQLAEAGHKVREALNGSVSDVPHPGPAEWKKIQAPMLAAAGVKTWATLAKGAKSVGIEQEGNVVKMVPTSGYANSGGKSLPELAVECAVGGRELGSSLLRAFDLCD